MRQQGGSWGPNQGWGTPIPKDHEPFLRLSVSAFIVLSGTALPFGSDTDLSAPFSYGLSTQNDLLPLSELFSKMDIIEFGIKLPGKPKDLLTDLFINPIGWRSISIAVNQSSDSPLFKGFLYPLGLTVGHTHFLCCLLQGNLTYHDQLQQMKLLQLPLTHNDFFVLHKEDILPLQLKTT
jgi:hypothetical protein